MYSLSNTGAAALIFPEDTAYTSALLVSNPPPVWLDDGDLTKICINESGIYCLYLLLFAENGTHAYIAINGRSIAGSAVEAEDGVICSSAVCSIHDAALPCSLSAITDAVGGSGIFLVARCCV